MSEYESANELDIEIHDDAENHRYVVQVDGRQVGAAVYHLRGGRHLFVHTEVEPEYGGLGIGQRLVRYALDDVRLQGGMVVPICPFFVSFIDGHPEYADVVDQKVTDRINKAEG